ncbi:hypothetical protein NQ318_019669 [Aromia moschata]|uniref:Homeobox domain-containing protein n=1 Tax=Aromia moschata TaxID=1265417 RepID=A0AAV8Z6P7_9CUCU|nr:hypothetical protein NQ318_019669 [Aromia moschata]
MRVSNETGNVAPDLATLRRRSLEGRLGYSATDTFAQLQHAYGDSVFSRAQVFLWFRHSQKEESRLKVNHAEEDLHLQEPMKMSIEYGILSVAARGYFTGSQGVSVELLISYQMAPQATFLKFSRSTVYGNDFEKQIIFRSTQTAKHRETSTR